MLTQISVASPSVQFMAAADPRDGVISLLVVQLEVEGEISLQPSLSSPLSGPHIIGLSTAQHAMPCHAHCTCHIGLHTIWCTHGVLDHLLCGTAAKCQCQLLMHDCCETMPLCPGCLDNVPLVLYNVLLLVYM